MKESSDSIRNSDADLMPPHSGVAVASEDGKKEGRHPHYPGAAFKHHQRRFSKQEIFSLIAVFILVIIHIVTMVAIYSLVSQNQYNASYAISVVIPGLSPNIFLGVLFFLIYKESELNGKGIVTIIILCGAAVAISLSFTYIQDYFPTLTPIKDTTPSELYAMMNNGEAQIYQPVYFNSDVFGSEFISDWDNITEFYALLDSSNVNDTTVYVLAQLGSGVDPTRLNPHYQGIIQGLSEDWSATYYCDICTTSAYDNLTYVSILLVDVDGYVFDAKMNNNGLYASSMIVPPIMYVLGVVIPTMRYKLQW